MGYLAKLVIFFILNFGALGIGGLFTGKGVKSLWYETLHKAPWTPPGFVFGLAWSLIMICFSFFMVNIKTEVGTLSVKLIYGLFIIQWFLNVMWNPLFFKYHMAMIALICICLLFIIVAVFLYLGYKDSVLNAVLMVPYFFWLIIAISLNVYIVLKN